MIPVKLLVIDRDSWSMPKTFELDFLFLTPGVGVACGAGTRAVLEARKEGSETLNVRGEVRGTR